MIDKKHTFFSFIYKGTGSALTFLNSIIAARFLSIVDRGDYQAASVNANAGMQFLSGYTSYYGYALPKRPEDKMYIVQMGNLFVFIVSFIIWLCSLVLIVIPNPYFSMDGLWAWTLVTTPLIFIFGYGTRILNALHEISWLNRANLAQPLLLLCIYLPFSLFSNLSEVNRLKASFIIWSFSYVLAVVFTMTMAYRKLHLKGVLKWRFSRKEFRGTLSYGSWSSVANFVSYGNYRIDYWFVQYAATVTGVLSRDIFSIYGAAVTAAEVLNTLAQSIGAVVFARMTGGHRADAIAVTGIATRQTLISSTFAAIGMSVIFPFLFATYGHHHAYDKAIIPFFILLPGLIVKAASNIVIQYATNSLGQPKTAIWMNGAAALINFSICLFLVPALGINGAALASTISYLAGFIIYIFWFHKVTGDPIKHLWRLRKADFEPYFQLFKRLQKH